MSEESEIPTTPPPPQTGTRKAPIRLVNPADESARKRSWLHALAARTDGGADGFPPLADPSEAKGTWFEFLTWAKSRAGKGEDPTYVPASNVTNAIAILSNDGRWKGALAYDEFAECITKTRMPPWHPVDSVGATLGDWTEQDTTRLESWFLRAYGIKLPETKVEASVSVAAHATIVHPVRTYLRSLEWDGVKRIHHWPVYLLGCPDTPYVRHVGRLWLISAVARVMRPGCKVDTMLVLEGKTGIRKSLALRTLAGDQWFTEISSGIDPIATPQLMRRKWIIELGELASLRRTRDYETIKSFLSRQEDNYRPPYGRRARDFPRQSVFAGSTNEERYLRDPTGARRFWPVDCSVINLRGIEIERDQLWAEALKEFDAGERWHIEDEDLVKMAVAEQSARYEDDAWTEPVREWCENGSEGGVPNAKMGITVEDVLLKCLAIEMGKWSHADFMRVGAVLRRIGWVPYGKSRPRRYRPESSDA